MGDASAEVLAYKLEQNFSGAINHDILQPHLFGDNCMRIDSLMFTGQLRSEAHEREALPEAAAFGSRCRQKRCLGVSIHIKGEMRYQSVRHDRY